MTHAQTRHPMRRITPIHQITPFTYRDGSTYLEVLNGLRDYVTQVAVPEVHRELNRIIGEFQEALSAAERERETDLSKWREEFDTFMENVTDSLAGLNDEAVAQNILDSDTETWEALGERFPTHTLVEALVSNVRADLNSAVSSLNTSITELDGRLTGDLDSAVSSLNANMNELDNTVSQLETTLNNTISSLDARVSTVESDATELEDRITQVRDTLTSTINTRTAGMVRGSGVGRILASKNARAELQDGDLLAVIKTPTFFEDFDDNEVESFLPKNWTPRFIYREGGYRIESLNGRNVLHASWSSQERRGLSWDLLDDMALEYGTVDLAVKWRPVNNETNASVRLITHGIDLPGDEELGHGYFGGMPRGGRPILGSYNGADDAFIYNDDRVPPTPQPINGEWQITRFRIHENERMWTKTWKYGTPEPDHWGTVNLTSTKERGWIGIVTWGNGITQYDWFSASFDGNQAPLGH